MIDVRRLARRRPKAPGGRVLIVVQNLPVPLDRRVWLECLALRERGFQVSVICPKGPGDPSRQVIDGVSIYKYKAPPAARGQLGFLVEFIYCWFVTALLSLVVAVRDGFDAIQACNPPDTYWALAKLWRPFGKKFVYDQHDLNPEVFIAKFGQPRGLRSRVQHRALIWLEKRTYQTADRVISTNESYRSIAIGRGGVRPERATVVRSGPDTTVMRPVDPRPELRLGRERLAVYLGVMGPQDGVDSALRAFAHVVHRERRTDCHFALLGFGDCLEDLKMLASELDLDDFVTFTGRVGLPEIADYLSTADLGICPDPVNAFNDVSTMNKTMEYMAYCLPIVSFDLKESRVSAGDAAIYLAPGDIAGFAKEWSRLLDDPDERVSRGRYARDRVSSHLDWQPQKEAYVQVWTDLLGEAPTPASHTVGPQHPSILQPYDDRGRLYIDLTNDDEIERFIRDRTPSSWTTIASRPIELPTPDQTDPTVMLRAG